MKRQFSEPATVAHLAADAFAVLLPDAEGAAALTAAEELRQAVQRIPVGGEKAPLRLEASIGVVFIDPLHGDAGRVLSAAETACAAAKESGRNQVAVYRQSDELIARRESSMQSLVQLLDALENDRLRLRCQRIVPIRPTPDRQLHYEVLLTVLDADGAALTLAPFISAAEHYNRMAAVDRAVVRKTLEWMGEHPAAMSSFGGFAINLSGDSLSSPGLVELIEQAFRDTGADPGKVCFEITESLAIANLAKASELIRRIKVLGCRFALDDFGSGMSSYAYLKNLPVDLVKIDGAFVKDLARSESDQAVVKSINEISHFLGKETIAEFVENDAILERLRHIGVDYAQGYGIEKPRPLADLARDLLPEAPSDDSAPADRPDRGNGAAVRHPDAAPAQSKSDRSLSTVGASTTPRSVTMASISDAGVTSKTGFHAPTPGAPTT
jgi:EAL domain-containing protein (putative c-di-GMP-specific phosphodiesterase class I)